MQMSWQQIDGSSTNVVTIVKQCIHTFVPKIPTILFMNLTLPYEPCNIHTEMIRGLLKQQDQ